MLNAEQQVLAYAVAVALVDAGGVVDSPPGASHAIEIGGGRLEPWRAMEAIGAGEMQPREWEEDCRRLEVAHLPLNSNGPAETGPS